MGEMVERVAEALWFKLAQEAGRPRSDWPENATYPDQSPQDYWRGMARAAIEAMREPTMAMELAAQASDHQPSTIWGKMIEEALK